MSAVRPLTTCTACGTTCDDIRLRHGDDGQVTAAERACPRGEQWLTLPPATVAPARRAGKEVEPEAAARRAAELLAAARHPLIAGLGSASTEAVRAAMALADRISACVDWTADAADRAATLALQTVGGVTATWGEVAQRAETVVLWGSDLVTTHPRHFERYTLEPRSRWLPGGRADRTLVVIDDHPTETMAQADVAVTLAPGTDYEALGLLRSLVRGTACDFDRAAAQTGVHQATWRSLAERLISTRYGAVVTGKRLAAAGAETLAELTQLAADLTAHTRWVILGEGSAGNSTGAANVLTWQTGYPLGVSLAQRYPQYGPDQWVTDRLLERQEVDTVLLLDGGLPERLSPAAAAHLEQVPTILLDWQPTPYAASAEVAFCVARPGVECPGTTYRSDGLAVPLGGSRHTVRPRAEAVLAAIVAALPAETA